MMLRHESETSAQVEVELPKDSMDAVSVIGSRPAAWVMVGHRPVHHCDSGVTKLPPAEHSYPSWLEEELLELKVVGA